jgi:hypothetical protein
MYCDMRHCKHRTEQFCITVLNCYAAWCKELHSFILMLNSFDVLKTNKKIQYRNDIGLMVDWGRVYRATTLSHLGL